MSFDFLPTEIEKIIIEKKNQIETHQIYQKVLNELHNTLKLRKKNIEYDFQYFNTITQLICLRTYNDKKIETIILDSYSKNGSYCYMKYLRQSGRYEMIDYHFMRERIFRNQL